MSVLPLSIPEIPESMSRSRLTRVGSKRKGLDKAIFQIEQAIKRAKSGEQTSDDHKALYDLQHLLDDAGELSSVVSNTSSSNKLKRRSTVEEDESSEEEDEIEDTPESNTYITHHREGSLTVDDAENPLQLLARASNLQLSPTPGGPSPGQISRASRKKQADRQDEDLETQSFFTSIRVNLDVSEDIDPIYMGLTTESEADELFDL